MAEYPISTGKNGMGCQADSGKTTTGLHVVAQKIGEGAPLNTLFESREPLGVWDADSPAKENLILTRILWLQGVEEGVNRGENIDTYSRYIYIHATNRVDSLGKEPVSAGCILMNNNDICELFDLLKEGDYVLINQ